MNIDFYKYNGAGNDFVVLDNREGWFDWNNTELIQKLCDRKFGVGADGILLLQNKSGYAFEMLYANRDGSRGSMCGNGGRCIVAFAEKLGVIKKEAEITFWGPDGEHNAVIDNKGIVKLQMQDVDSITEENGLWACNTGAPHYIQFVVNLESFPVVEEAQKVRDHNPDPEGVNINYVESFEGKWHVRPYERGVEDETLACGTGATATVLVLATQEKITGNSCDIYMKGGKLSVSFERENQGFKNIWLSGPLEFVFQGTIAL